MTLTSKISLVFEKASSWFKSLSARERMLVGGGAAILFIMALSSAYSSISQGLSDQSFALARLERESAALATQFERYEKLRAQLEQVQAQFNRPAPAEGVRSYIARLLGEKARVSSGGYDIRPLTKRNLGTKYVQFPFSLKYDTTDIGSTVQFLEELMYGKEPLLVTRIDIAKSRRADKLTVSIDVSSISTAENAA